MLEAFLRDVAAQAEEFERLQPLAPEGHSGTGLGYTTQQALAFIGRWKANLSAGRARVRASVFVARISLLAGLRCLGVAIATWYSRGPLSTGCLHRVPPPGALSTRGVALSHGIFTSSMTVMTHSNHLFAFQICRPSQAAEVKSGLDIFGLPAPAHAELTLIERQLEVLERMWGVVEEWQGTYAGWKETKFRDIKVGAASL